MDLPLVLTVFWGVQLPPASGTFVPLPCSPVLELSPCGGCTLTWGIEFFNKPPSKMIAFSRESQTFVPCEVQRGHCPLQTPDPEMVTEPLNSKFTEFSIPSLRREQLVLFLLKRVPKIGIFIRNFYLSIQTKTFKNHDSQSPPKSWD